MRQVQLMLCLIFLCGPAAVSFAEYYPGLSPDFFTDKGNQLGNLPGGSYGCTVVAGNTPQQDAGKLGQVIATQCNGQGTRTWVPYSPSVSSANQNRLVEGYWMVCCTQAGPRPHRRHRR